MPAGFQTKPIHGALKRPVRFGGRGRDMTLTMLFLLDRAIWFLLVVFVQQKTAEDDNDDIAAGGTGAMSSSDSSAIPVDESEYSSSSGCESREEDSAGDDGLLPSGTDRARVFDGVAVAHTTEM